MDSIFLQSDGVSIKPSTVHITPLARAAPLLPAVPRVRDQLLYLSRSPALDNIIRQLFRANARIGNGSSMDALRWERLTGQLLSPSGHVQKLLDYRMALLRLYRNPFVSYSDRQIIKALLIDIQKALSGQ